ncbi:DUF6078 family protein [Parabacteroides bouchesdurhonensis]|uniref:DUF6078 family protein n=1 Tax=Parabacteroides bouchesdurhonensis TaxID=1936995 RepID=UPI000C84DD6D|nr:DUF6078 family protein [Parabacteroides bouchesdurhonensis]
MKPNFDYKSVPYNFSYCFNDKCKRSAECLRHEISIHIPSEYGVISTISPMYKTPEGKDCPYFKPDKQERFALGITHLLDEIPHSDAVVIRRQMIDHFQRSTYYRCQRKERLISPDEQEYIRQLFVRHGIKNEPVYDKYVEQYNW